VKKLFSFFILILLISCDDGDIIVTSFEFDDVDLQLCQGAKPNEFVFFKINTTVNEAISYNFISATYSDIAVTESPISFDLKEDDNSLVYRQFNNTITTDYYCNNIPDSNIIVAEELISIEGEATITNEIVSEDDNDGLESTEESPNQIDPEDDPDEDGVPNYLDDDMADPAIGNTDATDDRLGIEDGYDDDGDDIPNFRDQDDDNDNVLTSAELENDNPDDPSFLDTDGDTIPDYLDDDDDGDGVSTFNYLDKDDDGDGILTKDEVVNATDNPMDVDEDEDGIPNYLDTDSPEDMANMNLDNPSTLPNTVITIFRTTLTISNLKLNEANEQFENKGFSFGFRDRTFSVITEKDED